MKRVLFLLMTVLAVATALTSCKKDKENAYTVKLLKTIIKDDTEGFRYDKYKFEYDEQNRLTEMSQYFYGGDLYYTTTFTYAGDDLVQVLNRYSSGSVETYEFVKNGNTITQKSINNGVITNYIIELNSDGLPVKQEDEQPDNYPNIGIYEYQDGNLTKKTDRVLLPDDYTEWVDYTYTYYYDNEKGALYHCKTPKWYLIMHLNDFGVKNNITEGGHLFRPWSVYTYKFDGAGFPTKRTSQNYYHMFENERVEEFIYIKK